MRGSTGVLMGHQRSSLPRLELGMRSEPGFGGSATSALGPFGRGRVDCRCRRDREARARLGKHGTGLDGRRGRIARSGRRRGRGRARCYRGGHGAKSTGSVAAGAGGGGVTPGGRLPGGISVTGAAIPIGVPLLGAPITVPLIGAPRRVRPRPDRSRQRRQPGCQAFRGRLPRAGQSRGSCLACRPREWGQRRAPAGSI